MLLRYKVCFHVLHNNEKAVHVRPNKTCVRLCRGEGMHKSATAESLKTSCVNSTCHGACQCNNDQTMTTDDADTVPISHAIIVIGTEHGTSIALSSLG